MPELPEVETVVCDLRPRLVGRCIRAVEKRGKALRRRWQKKWAEQLAGRQVLGMSRRGKWIQMELDRDLWLVVHLGMTGQLVVVPAERPLADHTHLILHLDRGGQLRYRDIRRFGSATVFPSAAAVNTFFTDVGLGPEPFDLPRGFLHERIKASSRPLKAILLDQSILAGIGNIYADEALFAARLPPTRLGAETTANQAQCLQQAIEKVLKKAIQARGASIRDYVDGQGRRGGYQEEFAVYGRGGQPCRVCGTPIEVMRLAGRSTHYCPSCQKRVMRPCHDP